MYFNNPRRRLPPPRVQQFLADIQIEPCLPTTKVTDAGLEGLKDLAELQELDLQNTNVTTLPDITLNQLRKDEPDAQHKAGRLTPPHPPTPHLLQSPGSHPCPLPGIFCRQCAYHLPAAENANLGRAPHTLGILAPHPPRRKTLATSPRPGDAVSRSSPGQKLSTQGAPHAHQTSRRRPALLRPR